MPSVRIKRAEADERLDHQRRQKAAKAAKLAKQRATPMRVEQPASYIPTRAD
jgi:hypothetical protein